MALFFAGRVQTLVSKFNQIKLIASRLFVLKDRCPMSRTVTKTITYGELLKKLQDVSGNFTEGKLLFKETTKVLPADVFVALLKMILATQDTGLEEQHQGKLFNLNGGIVLLFAGFVMGQELKKELN